MGSEGETPELEALTRDAFAMSPVGACACLLSIAHQARQYGEGVAHGASIVHRKLGPLPTAVDGGVRNVILATALLETASEALAKALDESGYQGWVEAVRDPEGRLVSVPDPAELSEIVRNAR